EAAEDAAVGADAAVDARRGLDAAVEDDREVAADVLAGDLAEAAPAVGVEREADCGLVVLVERRTRRPQVAAGDRPGPAHPIPHRPRVARRAARAGHELHPVRDLAVDEQRLARRRRTLLDDLQLEAARRLNDALRALDVADAGQLHHDLIAVGALLRDLRLGDAELVHAALDRLPRLHHRFVPQGDDGCRPHR